MKAGLDIWKNYNNNNNNDDDNNDKMDNLKKRKEDKIFNRRQENGNMEEVVCNNYGFQRNGTVETDICEEENCVVRKMKCGGVEEDPNEYIGDISTCKIEELTCQGERVVLTQNNCRIAKWKCGNEIVIVKKGNVQTCNVYELICNNDEDEDDASDDKVILQFSQDIYGGRCTVDEMYCNGELTDPTEVKGNTNDCFVSTRNCLPEEECS